MLLGLPQGSPDHSPPWWEDEKAEPPSLECDLGPPPELGPDVEYFLQEPGGVCGEDRRHHLPAEPPVEEYKKWVEWRGQMVDTPSWWWELEKVPEVEDTQELAQQIWASFELPLWTSEVYEVENYHLALPAPQCLHWKDFLLLPDPRFPCQDIWEEQWKKTIAYAQALQYWAKRANPPMLGGPSLLVRCVLKLHKMMEWYISFSSDIVLGSVALLEGFFRNQAKLTVSRNALPASADLPTDEVAMEKVASIGGPLEEPTMPQVLHEEWAGVEAPPNQFPGWKKVLHPSQLVATVGPTSPAFGESKWRYCYWSSEARRA